MRRHSSSPPCFVDHPACCRDGSACRSDFERYRATRDRSLRNELALRHEWLAVRHARGFRDRGQSLDDLTQVAWIGLIKSIERFDPDRGVGFPSFASPTIVGELKRHFRDYSWDVSVPRRAKEARTRVTAGAETLHQRLHRAPTPDELAAHLGMARETVVETLTAMGAHRARSLDTDDAVAGRLRDGDWTDRAEARVLTDEALRRLGERDRMMLHWRFVDDCTQADIADRIGISQVQVSRCLTASLTDLRRRLAPLRDSC